MEQGDVKNHVPGTYWWYIRNCDNGGDFVKIGQNYIHDNSLSEVPYMHVGNGAKLEVKVCYMVDCSVLAEAPSGAAECKSEIRVFTLQVDHSHIELDRGNIGEIIISCYPLGGNVAVSFSNESVVTWNGEYVDLSPNDHKISIFGDNSGVTVVKFSYKYSGIIMCENTVTITVNAGDEPISRPEGFQAGPAEFVMVSQEFTLGGLSEIDEFVPSGTAGKGGIIALNNDYDYSPDNSDNNRNVLSFSNEDDLVQLVKMRLNPLPEAGTVTLQKTNERIRIWHKKANEYELEAFTDNAISWILSNAGERTAFAALENSLWIEGISESDNWADTQISLSYTLPGLITPPTDCISLTVAEFRIMSNSSDTNPEKFPRKYVEKNNLVGSKVIIPREFIKNNVAINWSAGQGFSIIGVSSNEHVLCNGNTAGLGSFTVKLLPNQNTSSTQGAVKSHSVKVIQAILKDNDNQIVNHIAIAARSDELFDDRGKRTYSIQLSPEISGDNYNHVTGHFENESSCIEWYESEFKATIYAISNSNNVDDSSYKFTIKPFNGTLEDNLSFTYLGTVVEIRVFDGQVEVNNIEIPINLNKQLAAKTSPELPDDYIPAVSNSYYWFSNNDNIAVVIAGAETKSATIGGCELGTTQITVEYSPENMLSNNDYFAKAINVSIVPAIIDNITINYSGEDERQQNETIKLLSSNNLYQKYLFPNEENDNVSLSYSFAFIPSNASINDFHVEAMKFAGSENTIFFEQSGNPSANHPFPPIANYIGRQYKIRAYFGSSYSAAVSKREIIIQMPDVIISNIDNKYILNDDKLYLENGTSINYIEFMHAYNSITPSPSLDVNAIYAFVQDKLSYYRLGGYQWSPNFGVGYQLVGKGPNKYLCFYEMPIDSRGFGGYNLILKAVGKACYNNGIEIYNPSPDAYDCAAFGRDNKTFYLFFDKKEHRHPDSGDGWQAPNGWQVDGESYDWYFYWSAECTGPCSFSLNNNNTTSYAEYDSTKSGSDFGEYDFTNNIIKLGKDAGINLIQHNDFVYTTSSNSSFVTFSWSSLNGADFVEHVYWHEQWHKFFIQAINSGNYNSSVYSDGDYDGDYCPDKLEQILSNEGHLFSYENPESFTDPHYPLPDQKDDEVMIELLLFDQHKIPDFDQISTPPTTYEGIGKKMEDNKSPNIAPYPERDWSKNGLNWK